MKTNLSLLDLIKLMDPSVFDFHKRAMFHSPKSFAEYKPDKRAVTEEDYDYEAPMLIF